jgi:hypothetical protein
VVSLLSWIVITRAKQWKMLSSFRLFRHFTTTTTKTYKIYFSFFDIHFDCVTRAAAVAKRQRQQQAQKRVCCAWRESTENRLATKWLPSVIFDASLRESMSNFILIVMKHATDRSTSVSLTNSRRPRSLVLTSCHVPN